MAYNTSQLARLIGEYGGLVVGILLIALVVSLLLWVILIVWRKLVLPEVERVFGDGR